MKWLRRPKIYTFIFALLMVVMTVNAYADLESGLESLQDKVKKISIPLATIFLIVAGWQKMSGRGDLFVAALIGAIIIFAAPQIIDLFYNVFSR